METHDFQEKMASFPCMFNMPCYDHPVRNRLKNRQDKLEKDIANGIDDREKKRQAENALTWIFYQLGLYDRAIDMNKSVLVESGSKCVVALGNRVFMDWLRTGQVSEHFKLLVELSAKPDFRDQVLEAKADQAHCLEIIGGMFYLISAAELYENILASREHDRWRYLLGRTYRQLASMDRIEKPSRNKLNQKICNEKAEACFKKVVTCSDDCLVATSLVNIAYLHSVTSNQVDITEVDRAVTLYPDSEVYLVGGRALINFDAHRAVTLLERAVELDKTRSVSHHQLGKAYIRQLQEIGESDRDKVKEIREKAERRFRSAYDLSDKLNLTSLMELARLLKMKRNIEMAKKEASTLLGSRYTLQISIIDGHELLFQLTASVHDLVLSILTSIDFLNSESTNANRNAVFWTLFEKDQRYKTVGKLKGNAWKLLENLKRYRLKMDGIFHSISRLLRDGQIDDAHEVVEQAKDMAKHGLDREALLFLELVSFRTRMDTSESNCLRLKLLITEAKLCLKHSLSVFSLFFRQSFDLIFSNEEICGDEPELDSDNIFIKLDIVVLFNDSIKNSSTLCTDTAYGLEDVMSSLFQLKVAFNPILETSSEGGQDTSLVYFVKKHAVAVILVVFQGDGADTQYLLEKHGPFISENNEDSPDRRPLVVMIQCDEQPTPHLPADFKNLPCLSLGQPDDGFPDLFCLKEAQKKADKSSGVKEFVQAYFEGNDDNVMTLFNHLTRHSDQ